MSTEMNVLALGPSVRRSDMSIHALSSPLLVSDHWMHCFVGSQETLVRWAYDPSTDKLVAQTRAGLGWEGLLADDLDDLREELDDNDVLEAPEAHDDVRLTQQWPMWATPA